MKTKYFLIFALFLLLSSFLSAKESNEANRLTYSLTADFYVAPKTDYISFQESKNSYAKVTGLYNACGGRVAFKANYLIPISESDNPLLKDAHINLEGSTELTPLTLTAGFKTTYCPVPFLELQTGTQLGSGWNLGKLTGLAEYNSETGLYNTCNSFSKLYLNAWAQFLFQFDTGYLWPGKWNHVVMQYTYKAYYNDLIGTQFGNFWYWPPEYNHYAGFCNYQCFILAYQMPLSLFRAGFMFESDRHYSDKNLDSKYKAYNGTFNSISLSQITQWKFSQNDILSVAITFATRRGFKEEHTQATEEPVLTYIGNEWYFKRVAFSYTHNF